MHQVRTKTQRARARGFAATPSFLLHIPTSRMDVGRIGALRGEDQEYRGM